MTENVTALVTRDTGSGRERVGRSAVTQFATAPNLDPLLDNAKYDVGDELAKQIATESVKRLDEMALIGYPILSPEQRSVYEVVIRQVAEGVIDG